MQASEIKTKLEECGLPIAYRMFPENEAPALPWLVWYIDSETNFPADGANYHNIKHVTLELYTELKDLDAEAAVESAIADMGIWDKTEEYIDSERCYQIVYTLEV